MANAELPHTVVGIDIRGYTSHTTPGQSRLINDLMRLFDEACAALGVLGEPRDNGDGGFWLFPGHVPRSRLVSELPRELSIGLGQRNRSTRPEHQLRVRMAMHHGVASRRDGGFVSHALNQTSRILDAQAGRDLLDAVPTADVALLLSEALYTDTVADELAGALQPGDFARTRIGPGQKGAGTVLWACVWTNGKHGAPPPGALPADGPDAPGPAGASDAATRPEASPSPGQADGHSGGSRIAYGNNMVTQGKNSPIVHGNVDKMIF